MNSVVYSISIYMRDWWKQRKYAKDIYLSKTRKTEGIYEWEVILVFGDPALVNNMMDVWTLEGSEVKISRSN